MSLKNRNNKQRGFTLVELVVTLGIIGVVSAIAIPLFTSQQSTASKSVAVNDGASLALVVTNELKDFSNYGTAPTTNSGSGQAITFDGSLLSIKLGSPINDTLSTEATASIGTTIQTSGISDRVWCFQLDNGGSAAVYTQDGYIDGALSCTREGYPNTESASTTGGGGTSGGGTSGGGTTPATSGSVAGAPSTVAASIPSEEEATAESGLKPYNKATISWVPPADNGGSTITGYRVTASPGGLTCSTTGATTCQIPQLIASEKYTFTVQAENAKGLSLSSAPSNPITIANLPGTPTAVMAAIPSAAEATAEGGSNPYNTATINWQAAVSNGAAITDYVVTSVPGGMTCSTTKALTCSVKGLLAGTTYNFTVRASNAVGMSPLSIASNPVTIPGKPLPPTNLVATLPSVSEMTGPDGNVPFNRVKLSWTRSANTGGADISSYVVTSSPAGGTCNAIGQADWCYVTGLNKGTTYTFTAVAVNAVSESVPSAPSNSVYIAAAPSAPATATASFPSSSTATEPYGTKPYHTATISWTAGANDPTAPIQSYLVTAAPGGKTCTTDDAGRSCDIVELERGTDYTFSVAAVNVAGPGAVKTATARSADVPTAPSNVVATLPSAKAATVTTGANAYNTATVTWDASTANGADVFEYVVTSTPGDLTCTTATLTCKVTGLSAGTKYVFNVTPRNVVGSGNSGESNEVETANVPDAPLNVMAASTFKNLVSNPSAESGITNYAMNPGTGGAGSGSRVTAAGAPAGGSFYRYTWSAPTTAPSGYYEFTALMAADSVSAAQTYTWSGYVRPSIANKMKANIQWRDASGALLSQSAGTVTDTPAGEWTRISVTATSPANANKVYLNLTTDSTGSNWGAGATLDVDALQFQQTSRLFPYFDGSFANSSWLGYPNQSASVRAQTGDLAWDDPKNNRAAVNGYRIQYSTTGDFSSNVTTLDLNTNTPWASIPNLARGDYYVKVAAKNVVGVGQYSNLQSLPGILTVPGVPTNLALTVPDFSGSKINMVWNAPDNKGYNTPITGYRIQYSTNADFSGTYYLLDIVPTNGASETVEQKLYSIVTNLIANSTWNVRVAATNIVGHGAYSAPVSAVTLSIPPTPTGLYSDNGGSAPYSPNRLVWNNSSCGTNVTAEYFVQQVTGGGNNSGWVRGNTFDIPSAWLQQGKTFGFTLKGRCLNELGNPSPESPATAATVFTTAISAPSQPGSIWNSYNDGGRSEVAWNAVSCAAGTSVEYLVIQDRWNAAGYYAVAKNWGAGTTANLPAYGWGTPVGAYVQARCVGPNASSGASGATRTDYDIPIYAPWGDAWISYYRTINVSASCGANSWPTNYYLKLTTTQGYVYEYSNTTSVYVNVPFGSPNARVDGSATCSSNWKTSGRSWWVGWG